MVNVSDILGWGLMLFSIWLFFTSLSSEGIMLKLIGVIASIIIFITEIVYIYQTIKKKQDLSRR